MAADTVVFARNITRLTMITYVDDLVRTMYPKLNSQFVKVVISLSKFKNAGV